MSHGHCFDPTILREYDIRGVFGETLDVADAYAVGRCFATVLWEEAEKGAGRDKGGTASLPLPGHAGITTVPSASGPGTESGMAVVPGMGPSASSREGHIQSAGEPADAARAGLPSPPAVRPRVVVGRDGRLSSPVLEAALVDGLTAGGVDVVRIGLGPTPMLYYAEASSEDVQGGIEVTGSHNPGNHNGFKIVLAGRPFYGAAIQRLDVIAKAGGWISSEPGASGAARIGNHGVGSHGIGNRVAGNDGVGSHGGGSERLGRAEHRDVVSAYVERLLEGLAGIEEHHLAGLRIGWDAGNGAAGPVLEILTRKLPGEHHLLFSDVDGRFPNHHPDPTVEANLAHLQALVLAKNLHFGVAFDGDADRIGVVDSRGEPIWGDELLAIYAQDVLVRAPGATVIGDVKTSQAVYDRIAALGGKPIMAPSGHSLIKTKMNETGALLGGETSGHVFLADDYYGFDDGIYAAIRLIAATVRLGCTVDALRDALPKTVVTPELRFAVPDTRKFAAVEEVRTRLTTAGAEVVAIDGVRVNTPDGWWLLRASNTQAALTARAESETPEGLARLVAEIDRQLGLCGLSRT
ncbi:phosphomannomutase [Novosphingobium sp. Rr 2-17]|uniref:phosphomannomutase/phosphoglucomutase n=1 Tax=Novosphingobium sp. Rr 2-17 TaxID=555793 RepID=UPI000269A1CB|nr:phosphomannomutase/phosphoglucomutase [Novosphingobium sp. Rr 2-17]EIZ79715.1 phosphomannomutase [Novosphingobium sp. Rr 2-17]